MTVEVLTYLAIAVSTGKNSCPAVAVCPFVFHSETPASPDLQVTLSNLANGVNFYTDWYFDAGLEAPFNHYIDDFTVYIGRYPSYEMHLPSGLIEANVSTITLDLTIEGISTSTTTTTSPMTTTTTTTQASPGGLLFESLIILGIVIGMPYFKGKRRK